jgi:hypothetical protein
MAEDEVEKGDDDEPERGKAHLEIPAARDCAIISSDNG